MLAQNTPISCHTEAFVKTEVGCTVYFSCSKTCHLQITHAYLEKRGEIPRKVVFITYLVQATSKSPLSLDLIKGQIVLVDLISIISYN